MDRYKVVVGSLVVNCTESELELAAPQSPMKRSDSDQQQAKSFAALKNFGERRGKKSSRKLDLHGLTVAEAKLALEKFLSDAVMNQLHEIEIVHGLGTGALAKMVADYLTDCPIVSSFSTPSHNRGSTIVYI
jgi:DNA mismatch repair protein MutS2